MKYGYLAQVINFYFFYQSQLLVYYYKVEIITVNGLSEAT